MAQFLFEYKPSLGRSAESIQAGSARPRLAWAAKVGRRWLPGLSILLALALRGYELGAVRHNYAAGFPHGQGLIILEALSAGQ